MLCINSIKIVKKSKVNSLASSGSKIEQGKKMVPKLGTIFVNNLELTILIIL